MDGMTALEQMKKAVAEDRTYHDVETIEVDVLDLSAIIDDVEHLRAKVTELQAAGTRLVYERQNIDRDRFAIAEKVRAACVVAAGMGHSILNIDLAKVLGP